MNTYTFLDGSREIYRCQAMSINEADTMLHEACQTDAAVTPGITTVIELNTDGR